VVIEQGETDRKEYTFTDSFTVGRDDSCDIQIHAQIVSRKHIEVYFERDRWWVEDNHSANGTFMGGEKIDRIPISGRCTVELGTNGPVISFIFDPPAEESTRHPAAGDGITKDQVMAKYFTDDGDVGAGQHTMMVRQAFRHVQRRQKRKYLYVIALAAILLVVIGAYAVWQHQKIQEQKQIARDLFYRLKELQVAQAQLPVENQEGRKELLDLTAEYDGFLDKLGVYGEDMSREDRLILQVARVFGECDVDLPDNFASEVKRYIKKWQNTGRYERAINRAKANNYVGRIVKEMEAQALPPQFFYIALQESGFQINACGPPTRYGYAKGMWQFIPGTARDYGLKVGPLSEERVPDPNDERHDFRLATSAAARYIRFIYKTDAQASGLLVVASYNWGERKVANLIKQMPDNPRERNFWKLLQDHVDQFPKETYDYVFYIFSAAVIGEDPKYFGFDFDNPLKNAAAYSQ
jgi:membrane-bound lytic murein transglycosylase D